jgi:hypothetical protein
VMSSDVSLLSDLNRPWNHNSFDELCWGRDVCSGRVRARTMGCVVGLQKRRPVSAAKICRKVFLVVISAEENSIPPNKYLN